MATLVVLDFSGTLSIGAVRFAAPDRIGDELRRSGLWALGIDSAELFWERLVAPTWKEGSTTGRGYVAVVEAAVREVLRVRARDTSPDDVRRCVRAFAERYLACSTIAPQWHGFLRRLRGRDDAVAVVATDHYAEATAHIAAELGRLGVRGVPVATRRVTPGDMVVANSADLGCHKATADYWRAVARALHRAVSRVALIDDFGANEVAGDVYAETARVRRRRTVTTAALAAAFSVTPAAYPFALGGRATSDDELAALVSDAERFTMNVLSRPS